MTTIKMPKAPNPNADYRRIDGTPCRSDDPKRLLWYAVSCGFWTDDWAMLKLSDGIPVCPACGCPGMQVEAKQWYDGARDHELNGHARYLEFLDLFRGYCMKGVGWVGSYNAWLKGELNA